MISIAIINLKGGVGKSVTACNLAAELAAKRKSVLVVDLDKQGNTSKFFGVADYDRPCVSSVLLGMARVRDAIVETAIPAVALLPLRHADAQGQPHDPDGQRPAAVSSAGCTGNLGR